MDAIAGTIDIDTLLTRLAASRPVFHSEADLQHAFAWELHELDPAIKVRLEIQLQARKYLDLLFSRPDIGYSTAVELKYPTALWTGEHKGEKFALRNHGAQDVNAYHIVNDLARLEGFCAGQPGLNGMLVLITNDPSYWRAPTHGRTTNADAFRIYEGLELSGTRTWGPATGVGTMKGIEHPIKLAGAYRLHWREYSQVGGTRGHFRALIVAVHSAPSD